MPMFFIDVYDGCTAIADRYGTELGSIEEAADEAAALLPSFAREVIPEGQSHDFAAAVRDETGEVVYRAILLFRARFGTPSSEIHVWTGTDTGGDEIARSRELRREARLLGEMVSRATDELWGVRMQVRADREASRSAREERLKRGS